MLRITVVAAGKLKERFWKDACAEYLKRLGGYANVVVREVPDSNPEREAGAILDALPDQGPVVLLDIKGQETSSTGLAQMLDTFALHGEGQVAFIIGGSEGVTDKVRSRATQRLSFGPITLPHNLARVVLLEQLYRAFKIIRHEPYHK